MCCEGEVKITGASLTYKVAWTVTLTLTDTLTCNVLEGVVFTIKVLSLALKGPVVTLKESVVLEELVSVLESVLCVFEGVAFVLSKTPVV